jgi:hypothetical protein
MGAELYLDSILEPFLESCGDLKTTDVEDWEISGGYFRNSYNANDVMWAMGLSWWDLVIPMLDENGLLPIARARELVAMIEARPLTREALARHFLENVVDGDNKHPISSLVVHDLITRAISVPKTLPPEFESFASFLVKKRADLLTFLKKSIVLGERIACWL